MLFRYDVLDDAETRVFKKQMRNAFMEFLVDEASL